MWVTSPSSRASIAGGDNPQVVRGAVLIIIAVVLGFILLAYGFPGADETVSSSDDGVIETDSGGDGDTGSGPSVATTAPPTTAGAARSPGEVTVLVANGSGVSGAAQTFTDTLNADGYVTAEPANADRKDYTTTTIYYVGEEQAEAAAVATALGIDPASVQPMPDPPPTADGDLRNSTVLVIVGTDNAG
jgi:hypothetical protein